MLQLPRAMHVPPRSEYSASSRPDELPIRLSSHGHGVSRADRGLDRARHDHLSGGGAGTVGGLARRHFRRHRDPAVHPRGQGRPLHRPWQRDQDRRHRSRHPLRCLRRLCAVVVADRTPPVHRAARAWPSDAGDQPAGAVHDRPATGCARTQHRQLHGRQCDRAGARPLHRGLCRRRCQRSADAMAVHGGVHRLLSDVRGGADAADRGFSQTASGRNPSRCRCATFCACPASG